MNKILVSIECPALDCRGGRLESPGAVIGPVCPTCDGEGQIITMGEPVPDWDAEPLRPSSDYVDEDSVVTDAKKYFEALRSEMRDRVANGTQVDGDIDQYGRVWSDVSAEWIGDLGKRCHQCGIEIYDERVTPEDMHCIAILRLSKDKELPQMPPGGPVYRAENPPTNANMVLGWHEELGWFWCWYSKQGKMWFRDMGANFVVRPSHWSPLPEIPKDSDD